MSGIAGTLNYSIRPAIRTQTTARKLIIPPFYRVTRRKSALFRKRPSQCDWQPILIFLCHRTAPAGNTLVSPTSRPKLTGVNNKNARNVSVSAWEVMSSNLNSERTESSCLGSVKNSEGNVTWKCESFSRQPVVRLPYKGTFSASTRRFRRNLFERYVLSWGNISRVSFFIDRPLSDSAPTVRGWEHPSNFKLKMYFLLWLWK